MARGIPGIHRLYLPGERPRPAKLRGGKPLVEHTENRTIRRLRAKLKREKRS